MLRHGGSSHQLKVFSIRSTQNSVENNGGPRIRSEMTHDLKKRVNCHYVHLANSEYSSCIHRPPFLKTYIFLPFSSVFTHFRIESAKILLLCTLYTKIRLNYIYIFTLIYNLTKRKKSHEIQGRKTPQISGLGHE